jgi:hypothetical protein
MGRGRWGLGALFLVVASGGSAAAQVGAAPSGLGAPGAGPPTRTFNLQASALVEHDTNLTRESDALASQSGLTPEDTVYSPALSLHVVAPVGRQALFFDGSASYLFHQNNTRLNSEGLNFSGGGVLSAGACGAVVRGGYSRGRSELLFPEGQTLPGGVVPVVPVPVTTNFESTIESIETTEDAGLSVTCARASGIGAHAQVGQQWVSNSQAISGSGSYRATNASAGLVYSRPQFGSVALDGVYGRTIYGEQLTPNLVPRGFETTGANLSFNRQLGGRIQANLTVGFTHAHDLSPPVLPVPLAVNPFRDFSGLTYAAGASFRVTSRLEAKATFQRQITPTLLAGSSFEVLTGYGLDVSYTLGSRITLDVKGDRQESRTNGMLLVQSAQTLTNSRVNDLSASASYRMNRRISLQLIGTHETRDADNADFNYTNDRVALTLSTTF